MNRIGIVHVRNERSCRDQRGPTQIAIVRQVCRNNQFDIYLFFNFCLKIKYGPLYGREGKISFV